MERNWRNEAGYIFGDDFLPSAWAWEFLRRNPEYQKDWNTVKERLRPFAAAYPEISASDLLMMSIRKPSGSPIELGNEQFHVFDPPLLDGETARDGLARCGRQSVTHVTNWYGRKWGLQRILPPEFSFDERQFRWVVSAGMVHVLGDSGVQDEGLRYETVRFDFNLPIAMQIEAAKTWLEWEQKRRIKWGAIAGSVGKRSQVRLFPNYLRVLDAQSDGADGSLMAEILLPHITNEYPGYAGNKQIANWLTAAEKLSTSGYRDLLLSTPK
jgi:hypothetical protein